MTRAIIAVEEGVFNVGIRIRGGQSDYHREISRIFLLTTPDRNPLSGRLDTQLRDLDGRFLLTRAIEEICASGETTAFAVTGGGFADKMSWEALPELFEHEDRRVLFAPVRVRDSHSPWQPTALGEKLRVTSLIGHPGRSTSFTPNSIRQLITDVYARLGEPQRAVMEDPQHPQIIDTTQTDVTRWVDDLVTARPHLVLYFGHGESKPQPRILANGDAWLDLRELVGLITERTNDFPPFWSFIACSLGEANTDSALHGPAAFHIMSDAGATSMLAMRAPIRVSVAATVLAEFLTRFASGSSPEFAAAGARHLAFSARSDRQRDWALPAVWSVAEPMSRLSWGTESERATTSETALQLLRNAARQDSLGAAPLLDESAARAKRWAAEHRVRLDVESQPTPQLMLECAAILEAARRELGACPILLDAPPGGVSYGARLIDWAKSIRSGLLPGTGSLSIATALRNVASGSYDGLRSLLALPNAFVVFLQTPARSDAVWDTIIAAPNTTTIVMVQAPDTSGLPSDGWFRDVSSPPDDDDDDRLLRALTTSPLSLACLAAARFPLPATDLAAMTAEAVLQGDGRLIRDDSGGGIALADRSRAAVEADIGKGAIRDAHERIAKFLAEADRAPNWRGYALLHHLAGAEQWLALVKAINGLVAGQPSSIDLRGLATVLAKMPPGSIDALHPEILLDIAHRCILVQDLEAAANWLERASPGRDIDKARRAGLLSEVWKGRNEPGAQAEMWLEAEAAVAYAALAIRDTPQSAEARRDLRHHQAHLARLHLYFKSDAQEARKVLERHISEWDAEPDQSPATIAAGVVTRRNLAECLFEFAPFDADPICRDAARSHIARGLELADEHQLHQLACDTLYSRAKLAEREGNLQFAIDTLSDCAARARAAGYEVALRIAEMRGYWLAISHQNRPWDAATFQSYQAPLDYLDWHLWALRYAAQSRLWGAKQLMIAGDPQGAISVLRRISDVFKSREVLSGRSDRATYARTCAGLATLGEDASWNAMISAPGMDQWAGRQANEVWAEVK
ncbi:hypothetical protein [Mesorhizobium sp.]|uniref:hypothetical protein n=1 Tax=Mesorhizobium sp. TaxID=1871066 RepID=UPI000FE63E4C|nr:hypothetical protein [Mesorhizobium sp.]RWP58614.1 MAG: hypothetical protein EOR08_26590 [Mesorhizobium sp.]